MRIFQTLFITALALALFSCVSSSKHLRNGNYEKAIEKSVKKLMRKPGKTAELQTLKKAFELANQKDVEAIRRLKLSGQADIYDQLVIYYNRLNRRQEKVARLPEDLLNQMGFVHIDYSREIVESKQKAAEFFNAHALSLLQNGDKQDARQAYDEFLKVKAYFPSYYKIDAHIEEAHNKGINHVIFYFENKSRTVLPEDFEAEMLKISLKDLNSTWLDFDTYADQAVNYDYALYLSLKEIQTSPELVKEQKYVEEKRVDDGFDYVLDRNGNVMKDSTGNDIKVAKTKLISCYVTETSLHKRAVVSASLDFYDNRSGQLLKTNPITTEFVFDYRFATANGDLNALKKETRKIIGQRPVPFPTDLQMIFDTNEDLKLKAKNCIANNRRLISY